MSAAGRQVTKLALRICMHGTPREICAIARAAARAGVSDDQAVLLARIALEISKGNDCQDVPGIADGIRRQARKEHAANHPNGKWAELMRRYPHRWQWMDDAEPLALAWSTPMLDRSYNIREAMQS